MTRSFAACALALLVATGASAQSAVTSEVPAIHFVAQTTLARSPQAADPKDCGPHSKVSTSAAGKQVAAQGWTVTSEADLGKFHVVSFAASFEDGTSGSCSADNTNIAVYDGDKLVALASTAKDAHQHLGVVKPLEGGALLVANNDPEAPVAELHADDKGLRVTALSAEQPVCKGTASVPNVYGKSIKDARGVLIAKGWKPKAATTAPGEGDPAGDLIKHGIVEADSCGGGDLGECDYHYTHGSIRLSVTTIGGEAGDGTDSTVTAYSAKCQ